MAATTMLRNLRQCSLSPFKSLVANGGTTSVSPFMGQWLAQAQSARPFRTLTNPRLTKPFLLNLETRLDVILLRLHFCETIPQARHLISHRKVCVNNGIINFSRFKVSEGDIISFEENYARTRGAEIRRFFFIKTLVDRVIGKLRSRRGRRRGRRSQTELVPKAEEKKPNSLGPSMCLPSAWPMPLPPGPPTGPSTGPIKRRKLWANRFKTKNKGSRVLQKSRKMRNLGFCASYLVLCKKRLRRQIKFRQFPRPK